MKISLFEMLNNITSSRPSFFHQISWLIHLFLPKFQYIGSKLTTTLKCKTNNNNHIHNAQFSFPSSTSLSVETDMRPLRCKNNLCFSNCQYSTLWINVMVPYIKEYRQNFCLPHSLLSQILNIAIYVAIANHKLNNAYTLSTVCLLLIETYNCTSTCRCLRRFLENKISSTYVSPYCLKLNSRRLV